MCRYIYIHICVIVIHINKIDLSNLVRDFASVKVPFG